MPEKTDYEVGYGKPPKHTQFRPGQSGFPGGRKKAARSIKDRLREELAQTLTVVENGRQVRVTKMDLLIKGLLNSGARGNVQAQKHIFTLIAAHGLDKEDAFQFDTSDETLVGLIDRCQAILDLRKKSHLYLEVQPFRSLHYDYRRKIEAVLKDQDASTSAAAAIAAVKAAEE